MATHKIGENTEILEDSNGDTIVRNTRSGKRILLGDNGVDTESVNTDEVVNDVALIDLDGDDTVSDLQTAIDNAGMAQAVRVAGSATVSSPISVSTPCVLDGTDASITCGDSTRAIRVQAAGAEVFGFDLDGDSAAYGYNVGAPLIEINEPDVCVHRNHCVDSQAAGVTIAGESGARIDNIRVEHNRIEGSQADSVSIHYCDDSVITGNVVRKGVKSGPQNGIQVYKHCSGIKVSENTVYGDTSGSSYCILVGHGSTDTGSVSDVAVSNNQIYDPSNTAINVQTGVTDVVVDGNLVSNGDNGIVVDDTASDVVVSDNILKDVANSPIEAVGEATLTGNYVAGSYTSGYGITVYNDHSTVTGNTVQMRRGIRIANGASAVTVSGNNCEGDGTNTDRGIFVDSSSGSDYNTVVGNTVTGYTDYPILTRGSNTTETANTTATSEV